MTLKFGMALIATLFSVNALALPNAPVGIADPAAGTALPVFQNDPSYRWCGNVLSLLDEAREQAGYALSMGDYESASRQLIEGLRRALAYPGQGVAIKPLTARAIARGVQLADQVLTAVASAPNGAQTGAHFLFGYYDFISHVANELDLPLFIPYQYCHRFSCGGYGVNEADFESRFVQYAKDQVQVVLDNLAEFDGYRVFPVGSPRAFLKALELTTGYAANDLGQSLWSARYACARQGLMRLNMRLQRFNSGDGSAYLGDIVAAVGASYFEARDVLSSVYVGSGCGRD